MVKTIGVDPGHGGSDHGASGYGLVEKDVNLDVGLTLQKLLEKDDHFHVVMTRTADTTVSLEERTDLFNREKVDIAVSIHHNAGDGSGTAVLCTVGDYPESVHFAKVLLRQLKKYCGLSTWLDGIYRRQYPGQHGTDYYHMIRETTMTSVIGENGFIDNKHDNEKIKTQAFQRNEAQAYYEALGVFYGYKSGGKAPAEPNKDQPNTQPKPISKPKLNSSGLLRKGDQGMKVKRLQQNLIKSGEKLPEFGADGIFGEETERALKAFQAHHGLVVDGLYGAKSKATLAKVLNQKGQKKPIRPYPGHLIRLKHPYMNDKNSGSHDIAAIQRAVKVKADGIYGPQTANAVGRYQSRHGLTSDRIVGPKTWNVMF